MSDLYGDVTGLGKKIEKAKKRRSEGADYQPRPADEYRERPSSINTVEEPAADYKRREDRQSGGTDMGRARYMAQRRRMNQSGRASSTPSYKRVRSHLDD